MQKRRHRHEIESRCHGGSGRVSAAALSSGRAGGHSPGAASRPAGHPRCSRRGAAARGQEARAAARSSAGGCGAMNWMVRQALSLGLAWVAAGAAESAPRRANPSAPAACAGEWNGQARLAPLWMAAPGPAGPGAPRARLLQVSPPAGGDRFHPARFRGRAGWAAPGSSSSRFLPVRARSLSAFSRVRRGEDLTDLHQRRARGGRGGAGRGAARISPFQSSLVRARGPADASILSVSSSLY
jgi:hypothetical protein